MGRLLANKYSGENQRLEHDQYLTPLKPVVALVNLLKDNVIQYQPEFILDPCAGKGVWGQVVKSTYTDSILYGVDIDDTLPQPAMYDYWYTGDFIGNHMANKKFDLIISNPPFKLAEKFVYEAFNHIAFGGVIAFMLPLGFMSSVGRYKRIFTTDFKPDRIFVSSRRIDFTGQGSPHTDIAMFVWGGNSSLITPTEVKWFDWESDKYED